MAMTPFSPDDLSRELACWRLNPPADPGFRTAVRARLDAATGQGGWLAYVRQHAGAVAASLVLAVAAGALGGWGSARARAGADREHLARAYVEQFDPRMARMP